MKAIELKSKTDKKGHLKIDFDLGKSEANVRVLILIDDSELTDIEDEKIWLKAISENPSFDFLNDPVEEVYTVNDGDSFDD